MKHAKGIDLVEKSSPRPISDDEPIGLEHTYRIEVWSDAPEAGGELLETISRATDFQVSVAAYHAALRQRPGKVLLHLNGRHRMSAEKAPDPPRPLR